MSRAVKVPLRGESGIVRRGAAEPEVVGLRERDFGLLTQLRGKNSRIGLRRIAEKRDVSRPRQLANRGTTSERDQRALLVPRRHAGLELDENFARNVVEPSVQCVDQCGHPLG